MGTTTNNLTLLTTLRERLRRIEHVALDMDGTIYRGGTVFSFTNSFLSLLSELGIGYTFLTNNSSKSISDYVLHLRKLGISANADQIYTSTQASIEYLKEEMPYVQRLFLLGTNSMGSDLTAAGFDLTDESASDEPDAVLVGFDTDLKFSRLCRAAYWIKQGKPFIASHPDRVCPTDDPTILVDCGAICAALAEAAGHGPDAVVGKPDPRMLRGLMRQHDLTSDRLAMVGDRLYTDIEMAHRAGALGVLVLTGEATVDDAARHRSTVDIIVSDIAEFGRLLAQTRNGPTVAPSAAEIRNLVHNG